MKRGIITFIENKDFLIKQLLCLYTSLKEIGNNDTDLIVFGPDDALKFVPDDCVKILYNPISNLPEWNSYYFINSISCLECVDHNFLDKYDLFLRCDVDTFLTPAWNSYFPELYTTGRGEFVNDIKTKNKLLAVSQDLGLKHNSVFNIGSTHYGNPHLIKSVCMLSVDIAKYILEVEFKQTDGRWPSWYKGVASLYATEIATNHIVDEFIIDADKLDFDSTSNNLVKYHPHIHCWHTSDIFSKFSFIDGIYNNIDVNTLNISKINEYCLYISLKSRKYYK